MLPLYVSLSAQLPLARDKQPYYFTLLTVQWTMTVSHGVFWWSYGGVPSHQIRAETVALALAESSGFTLLNAVIKIELAWMIDRFCRKSYSGNLFAGRFLVLTLPFGCPILPLVLAKPIGQRQGKISRPTLHSQVELPTRVRVIKHLPSRSYQSEHF